jgi:2-polyprenyl-3-methyl-5-hydroxy-6-metoxy-1,4-benzoquinol methylase
MRSDETRREYQEAWKTRPRALILPPHILTEFARVTSGKVFDIGSGDGRKLRRIIEVSEGDVREVVAIEPSPLWKEARREFEEAGIEARIQAVSFEEFKTSQSFDVIFMLEVLEHISLTKRGAVMEKITSLLAPGGVFCLSTPNRSIYRAKCWLSGERPDPTHVRELNYAEFRQFLSSYFEQIVVRGTFPYMGLIRRVPRLSRHICRFPPTFSHCLYAVCHGQSADNEVSR